MEEVLNGLKPIPEFGNRSWTVLNVLPNAGMDIERFETHSRIRE
jgi:hypothetical protein